jgi:hypothetical protein
MPCPYSDPRPHPSPAAVIPNPVATSANGGEGSAVAFLPVFSLPARRRVLQLLTSNFSPFSNSPCRFRLPPFVLPVEGHHALHSRNPGRAGVARALGPSPERRNPRLRAAGRLSSGGSRWNLVPASEEFPEVVLPEQWMISPLAAHRFCPMGSESNLGGVSAS